MAEGLIITKKFTLVNAPAGSGKTTSLSKSLKNLLSTPNKKILCITFTNRAANQLKEKIESEKVEISTIHSFISSFMRPFLKLGPIIEFFLEFYEHQITTLLESEEEKDLIKKSRYKERFNLGENYKITVQTIKENINLDYGETQFTSYLHGRLSHDDLLIFAKALCKKFRKLSNVISQRYSYIFIDEYQDTQSEILELFYNACLGNETKLVLLGDEMQQIYNERVEGFQTIIDQNFNRDLSLKNNWRSQGNIVKVLNHLYFDSSYHQYSKIAEEDKPKIIIVKDLIIENKEDTLQLVLYNSDLFKAIDAYNLFNAFNEKYKLFDKYSSKEILLNMSMDNPDDLIVLLIFITDISNHFDNREFGQLINKILAFKFSNKEIWNIKSHLDKIKVAQYMHQLSEEIKKDITIEQLLNFMRDNEIIYTSHIDMILSQINDDLNFKEKILPLRFIEFLNCYKESKNPKFSTQHAVKGEGYDRVSLNITDGKNPNVKMYFFLELFSKNMFNYKTLSLMKKQITQYINSLNDSLEIKVSKLKAADYKSYEQECRTCLTMIKNSIMKDGKLFEEFFQEEFLIYEDRPNYSNFMKCVRLKNKIEGALLAYKLFYVGCSRAKKKLSIYVKYKEIDSFKDEFISKMNSINFDVEVN
ncbi:UvrD-helicase domain-containing protein [Lysinibacillus fusiformis]|uniref:UvrD-helicase domain-containing protein n=1 Tax=Lysinibacillus fusiformis TaxID=28031 RepID=UPI001243EA49|nr:UvrD-helicase domain-containing protein [Lysinibacillus fusiformis]KAB0442526.1 hypothetical protein CH314_14720 [Lysinibacillus fusiformis]